MLLRSVLSSKISLDRKLSLLRIKLSRMAASSSKITATPPVHRLKPGESFNRDWFLQKVPVLGLRLPASRTTEFMRNPALKE
jgi:hypothetical protein